MFKAHGLFAVVEGSRLYPYRKPNLTVITDEMESVSGWVPYLEVDDLPAAVSDAKNRGASIIAEDFQGPAGVATFILDPGGATIALWKRASGA